MPTVESVNSPSAYSPWRLYSINKDLTTVTGPVSCLHLSSMAFVTNGIAIRSGATRWDTSVDRVLRARRVSSIFRDGTRIDWLAMLRMSWEMICWPGEAIGCLSGNGLSRRRLVSMTMICVDMRKPSWRHIKKQWADGPIGHGSSTMMMVREMLGVWERWSIAVLFNCKGYRRHDCDSYQAERNRCFFEKIKFVLQLYGLRIKSVFRWMKPLPFVSHECWKAQRAIQKRAWLC